MLKNLKIFFATEHSKLKEMSTKEKVEYIWEYYKIHIIAFMFACVFIISIINTLWFNPQKEMYFQITFYGGFADSDIIDSICMHLEKALMTPEERETMQIAGTVLMVDSEDPQVEMANRQRFVVMLAAREIDLLVISKEDLITLAPEGFFLPLNELLPDNITQMSEKLIFAHSEYGVESAYGIMLDNNRLFEGHGLITQGKSLAVMINTQRNDAVRNGIEYIFADSQE